MNEIKQLFFNLTPTTLAAIVADLDNSDGDMERQRQAAMATGYDNCGDEFNDMLREARAERDGSDQRAEDMSGYNGTVAASLARQR